MKINVIGAFEAKTHFSELLERVRHGEAFIVTRRGKPIARLGPSEVRESRPVYGSAKGSIKMSRDFDAPLDDMSEYEQ
jgi:prevent-host-death family protein